MENITLKGDVDFVMKGDDKDNNIRTDGGDDELYGGEGDDLLSPGKGNDFVYGEGGNDVLILTGSGTLNISMAVRELTSLKFICLIGKHQMVLLEVWIWKQVLLVVH